jgi:mannan endo-1,4-beta-mannosidase
MIVNKKKLMISAICLFATVANALAQEWRPADKEATPEAVALLKKLQTLQQSGVMYGHQDDLLYGYEWWGEPERSDTREAAGDYPAIAGFELGELELGYKLSLDSVAFADIADRWKWWNTQGGIVTVSWHAINPITSQWPGIKQPNGAGSAWDVQPLSAEGVNAVRSVLPDGADHAMFVSWLERLARFFLSIRDGDGQLIPFIFRPYHEHSGSFFWWGRGRCTDEEYASLWRFTVDYLRSRGCHQILFAYNTDKVYSPEEYLRGYPGDEYVDMLSLDWYGQGNDFVRDCGAAVRFVSRLAEEHKKPFALSECGPLTDGLLDILAEVPCSYLLTWRHAPVRGHRRAWGREGHNQMLQKMQASQRVLFLGDI